MHRRCRQHLAPCLLLAAVLLPLAAHAADSDGDGVDDSIDAFPANAEATTDTDGDGKPDQINLEALTVFYDSFESGSANTGGWAKTGSWHWGSDASISCIIGYYCMVVDAGSIFGSSLSRSVTLPGSGIVAFYLKGNFTSSAKMQLLDGSTVLRQWTANQWYQFESVPLSAGTHTIKFQVPFVSGYLLDAWLDDVRVYRNSTLTEDTDDDNDGIPDAFDPAPLDPNSVAPLDAPYKGSIIREAVSP